MKNINPTEWARQHKRDFANNFIKQANVQPADTPVAIFMAGLPGAGKTEFTQSFLKVNQNSAIRIDMDEIATHIESYRPEQADRYREAATMLLNKIFDLNLKRKLNFIMDGTLGHNKAISNIERTLKAGYQIKIFYLCQDPRSAWQYTQARELIEHRAISKEGFIRTYYSLIDNLRTILEKIKHPNLAVDLVIKKPDNGIKKIISSIGTADIDKHIEINYNREKLERKIDGKD